MSQDVTSLTVLRCQVLEIKKGMDFKAKKPTEAGGGGQSQCFNIGDIGCYHWGK